VRSVCRIIDVIKGYIHPVLTSTERETPVSEANQILNVEPGLLQLSRFVVLVIEAVAGRRTRTCVWVNTAYITPVIANFRLTSLIVETGNESVTESTGIEEKLQLVVDAPGMQRFVRSGVFAI